MLKQLRKSSKGAISKILIALLIASFGAWGIADIFYGKGTIVLANVNDQELTLSDFNTRYRKTITDIRIYTGKEVTEENANSIHLKKSVFDLLINEMVLKSVTAKMGIVANDSSVIKSIQENPLFIGKDRKFIPQAFLGYLKQIGTRTEDFSKITATKLTAEQFNKTLKRFSYQPKKIAKIRESYLTKERQVSYFLIKNENQKINSDKVDPSKLKKYFNNHKNNYTVPNSVDINLLIYDSKEELKKVVVSKKEIAEYYEKNKNIFGNPEKRKIDIIKLSNVDLAKQNLKQKLKFEEIAKQQGLSAKDYEWGIVLKSQLPDEKIAKAAFKMKQNDIGQIIQGEFGATLVRVTKIIPSDIPSLEKLTSQIKSTLSLKKLTQETRNKTLEQVEEQRSTGVSFEDIAKNSKHLNVVKVKYLTANGTNEKLEQINEVSDLPLKKLSTIVKSDLGSINRPISVNQLKTIWFEVTAKHKPFTPTLKKIEAKVIAGYKKNKKRLQAQKKAEKYTASTKSATDINKAAKKEGLKAVVNNWVSTSKYNKTPEVIKNVLFKRDLNKAIKLPIEKGFYVLFIGKERSVKADKKTILNMQDEIKKITTNLTNELFLEIARKYQNITINDENLKNAGI